MNTPMFWKAVRNDGTNLFEDMEPEEIIVGISELIQKMIDSGIFAYHGPLDTELKETGNGGTQYLIGACDQILECCRDYLQEKEYGGM